MYSTIYVALDNSEHSDAASTVALDLAAAFDAHLIGMHVYAARMHDYRFKQMEYTLPEEYQDEAELLRQRRIHDSLITTGLELISDSYTCGHLARHLRSSAPIPEYGAQVSEGSVTDASALARLRRRRAGDVRAH
jgi:nucleotide-binding universal stress UspA family protein